MSTGATRKSIYLQELMGREVVNLKGQRLGRVVEFLAEPEGDELCLAALLIGPRAWLGRFGWAKRAGGTVVRWEEIDALSPRIVVRTPERG